MRLSTVIRALPVVLLPGFAMAANNGQLAAGSALFAAKCQECHGAMAEDGAGGDIRGATASEIARAVRGFEQMPPLELTEAEITAIAAYLRHLESK